MTQRDGGPVDKPRLSDVLEALVTQWWSEPDGMWAVNLSKRRCAEQLKAILDDPDYSIQTHLADADAMLAQRNKT